MRELKDTFIICNPLAGGGLASKRWNRFSSLLQEEGIRVNYEFTQYPGHATELAEGAVKKSYTRIAVFGGDGTFNEVIQGVVRNDQLVSPELVLIFLCAGSSCDFEKAFDTRKGAIERLLSKNYVNIDLCKVQCRGFDGEEITRYFVANSSIGVISHAIAGFNQGSGVLNFLKKVSVDLAALVSGVKALASFKSFLGELFFDDNGEKLRLKNLTVFKSPYFGGGMNYGVDSKADDGLLHVATIDSVSALRLFFLIPSLYTGKILNKKPASYRKCRAFEINSGERVFIETDGEIVGFLPAKYRIYPGKLRVII